MSSTPAVSGQGPPAFRLLDLPPEIRNNIYEIVATDTKIKLRSGLSNWREGWPGICFVNRQIRAEVLPLIYGNAMIEARVRDMDFGSVILFMQRATLLCRRALLSNKELVVYIDEYSGRPASYQGLMDWIRLRRKHYFGAVDFPGWKIEVKEAACRKDHDWETGDWFLEQAGYLRLWDMLEDSDDILEKLYLWELTRAIWNFAHPEESLKGETVWQEGCPVRWKNVDHSPEGLRAVVLNCSIGLHEHLSKWYHRRPEDVRCEHRTACECRKGMYWALYYT